MTATMGSTGTAAGAVGREDERQRNEARAAVKRAALQPLKAGEAASLLAHLRTLGLSPATFAKIETLAKQRASIAPLAGRADHAREVRDSLTEHLINTEHRFVQTLRQIREELEKWGRLRSSCRPKAVDSIMEAERVDAAVRAIDQQIDAIIDGRGDGVLSESVQATLNNVAAASTPEKIAKRLSTARELLALIESAIIPEFIADIPAFAETFVEAAAIYALPGSDGAQDVAKARQEVDDARASLNLSE